MSESDLTAAEWLGLYAEIPDHVADSILAHLREHLTADTPEGQAYREALDTTSPAVERVRELHRPMTHRGYLYCMECSDGLLMDYPCLTIRVLDGEAPQ